jgi:UDP-glucuronate 4-epimerase
MKHLVTGAAGFIGYHVCVPATHADIDDLARDCGYQPTTPLETGIARYVAWYREFYGL